MANRFPERIDTKYLEWRKSVLLRDKYSCVRCGSKDYLGVHHIKSYDKFPELRIKLSNGQTLCNDCYKKTDNYVGRLPKIDGGYTTVLIRQVPKNKYVQFRGFLMGKGMTIASWFREAMEYEISE